MNRNDLFEHVNDPARLTALRAVALLDTPTEEAFDRLTRLASRFVSAPVSLVSLIDSDRQFFKSCIGLPEPWSSLRETPLSHSFCQHNLVPCQPLLVEDARQHPLFRDNLAIRDLSVIAYLGIPLVTSDGYVLGSFCVIDSRPRQWDQTEVSVVQDLADAVMTEIQLRTEIQCRRLAEDKQRQWNQELHTAYRNLEQETAERLRLAEELRQRDHLLIQQSRLAAMGEMISNIAHQWRQPLNMLALLVQELPLAHMNGRLDKTYLEQSVKKSMDTIGHMSMTIDNFRNFFKPDKSKVEFNVVDTVHKTLSLLDFSMNGERIETRVTASGTARATGYPNEYAQALLNILINARDALVSQQVLHPVITIAIDMQHGRSVLTVTDNAGGIPAEIADRIFEPYFTTKGPEQGTGIGLHMSKMIIEKNMGGSLTASNVTGGAEFRIEL